MNVNYFDFGLKSQYPVDLEFDKNVVSIRKVGGVVDGVVLPGLIDSHVHIESSMLTPFMFSTLAVKHGVVGVVTDPHEVSNVLGVEGFNFMLNDARKSFLKIFFGVPSCVPATNFETSGAILSSREIDKLLQKNDVVALSEVMNFPGVLHGDKEVLAKIELAKKYGKRIDGHAPGLIGSDLDKYIQAGITTDHEAYSYDEAVEKIRKGMLIQIREGSAAKNFETLYPLIDEYPDNVMLCTDDSHPDDLQKGYINLLIKRGLKKGLSFVNLYKAAFFNPVKHYGLNVGQLRVGDSADFIVVDNLKDFNILQTYVNGRKVFDVKQQVPTFIPPLNDSLNKFNATELKQEDIRVETTGGKLNIIRAFDGELITDVIQIPVQPGEIKQNVVDDIIKIVVVNRYDKKAKPVVGFINGFGLKDCAIASTIAHDSHNIIAVGTDDDLLLKAINKLVELKGGIVVADKSGIDFLKLEIAGLMTTSLPDYVAEKYSQLNSRVISNGAKLKAPFMTLSFMALLVIPKLKIGDKGLFDISKFSFVDLVEK